MRAASERPTASEGQTGPLVRVITAACSLYTRSVQRVTCSAQRAAFHVQEVTCSVEFIEVGSLQPASHWQAGINLGHFICEAQSWGTRGVAKHRGASMQQALLVSWVSARVWRVAPRGKPH